MGFELSLRLQEPPTTTRTRKTKVCVAGSPLPRHAPQTTLRGPYSVQVACQQPASVDAPRTTDWPSVLQKKRPFLSAGPSQFKLPQLTFQSCGPPPVCSRIGTNRVSPSYPDSLFRQAVVEPTGQSRAWSACTVQRVNLLNSRTPGLPRHLQPANRCRQTTRSIQLSTSSSLTARRLGMSREANNTRG